MAEAVKQEAPKPGRIKVLSLATQEGGVSIPGGSQMTLLTPKRDPKRPAAGTVPDLDMELVMGLGGVVIRLQHQGKPVTLLVPLAHIRCLELAE